jgi:amino acid adenylation domain-containing protein
MRIVGHIETAVIKDALDFVLGRHDALSINIGENSGHVYQTRGKPRPRATVEEMGCLPAEKAWRTALLHARSIADAPLNVRHDVCRARIIKITEEDHLLVLVIHMLASDGTSLSVLFRELQVTLDAFRNNSVPKLATSASSLEYAKAQRDSRVVNQDSVRYWVERIRDIGLVAPLPYDGDPGDGTDVSGFIADCRLSSNEVELVSQFAARKRVTRFAVTLASFGLVLRALTGRRSIVVPAPVSTREAGAEHIVGHFLNTLPYRLDFDDHGTFDEAVITANRAIWDGWEHRFAPFQLVVAQLGSKASIGPPPRPNVMLAQNTAPLGTVSAGNLTFVPIALPNRTSKFDLTLIAAETAEWHTRVTVRSAALSAKRAGQIVELYRTILVEGARRPERLSEELWSSEPLRHVPLGRSHRFVSFVDAFEAISNQRPNAVAIDDLNASKTYRELAMSVSAADYRLRDAEIQRGDKVLLGADRTASTYIAYLAILRSGAIAVPFDPRWPADRIASIIDDTNAVAIIGKSRFVTQRVQRFLQCEDLVAPGPGVARPRVVEPNDPAYIIFTSGTSGRPKGAILPHRALVNLAYADGGAIGVHPADRVAQFAALFVDASVWDIVATFMAGATLIVIPDDVRVNGPRLAEFLVRQRVSIIKAPPSTLVTIPAFPIETLRVVISAGEPCPRTLAETWRPHTQFFNAYGPTEAGVWAALERFEGTFREHLEIGYAVSGTSVSVRTQRGKTVQDGCVGELWIEGDGVGLGYVNSDKLTHRQFVLGLNGTAYRSGDRARRLSDGRFEFLGRSDRQIKLRGNRIQLEEIEITLHEHPKVHRAAVLAEPEQLPERLVAFVELQEAADDEVLIRHLRKTLPDTMLPERFVRVSRWPLSAGGKTDLNALRVLWQERNDGAGGPDLRFYKLLWEPRGRGHNRVHSRVDVLVGDDVSLMDPLASIYDRTPNILTLHAAKGVPYNVDMLVQKLRAVSGGRSELQLAVVCDESSTLGALLPFLHAAIALIGSIRLAFTLVTVGAFGVYPDDTIRPKARAMAGLVKVVPQESPDVVLRLADVGGNVGIDKLAPQIEEAIERCAFEPAGVILALRDGTTFRRRLVETSVKETNPIRNGGVYVITGGLGGIGRVLALRLARDYQVSLVLASRSVRSLRSPEPWADASRSAALSLAEQLESYGSRVEFIACDVAEPDDVNMLVSVARSSFGRIDGLIHCAGVGSPASFPAISLETIAHVMRPKDTGTRILLAQFPLEGMDFVASMSSTASFMGGFGSAVYTAANLVQEAHADQVAANNVVTIGWGRWIESGMVVKADVPYDLAPAFAQALQHGIDDETGYRGFITALGVRSGLIYATRERLPSYEPTGTSDSLNSTSAGDSPRKRPRPVISTSYSVPRSPFEAWLLHRFEETLSIDGIGVEDDLFVLGGHSLNAGRLASVLSEDFDIDVSLATVFRYPTVQSLARTIVARTSTPERLTDTAEKYLYGMNLPLARHHALRESTGDVTNSA